MRIHTKELPQENSHKLKDSHLSYLWQDISMGFNVLKALLFLLIYLVFLSVVFVIWLNSQDVNFFFQSYKTM